MIIVTIAGENLIYHAVWIWVGAVANEEQDYVKLGLTRIVKFSDVGKSFYPVIGARRLE